MDYLGFYGLKLEPFRNDPDERFYFESFEIPFDVSEMVVLLPEAMKYTIDPRGPALSNQLFRNLGGGRFAEVLAGDGELLQRLEEVEIELATPEDVADAIGWAASRPARRASSP